MTRAAQTSSVSADSTITADYAVIGGGIVGLAVAHAIRVREPAARVVILEKENNVAEHGSGRNSGVLHAGFYYAADSLKARFRREGNDAMKAFARTHHLALRECGKVVVAKDEADLPGLHELYRRGRANGVELELVDNKELADLEPKARTHERALWSPRTASVGPAEVTRTLRRLLETQGVTCLTGMAFERRLSNHAFMAGGKVVEVGLTINCAGLYADRIAHHYGVGLEYTVMPFKGVYVKYDGMDHGVQRHIYPVPNLGNPFLGVHYTLTAQGALKIGPTATPAFWREHYQGFSRFSAAEMAIVLREYARLIYGNQFGFRRLAVSETRKLWRPHLIAQASALSHGIETSRFTVAAPPGIRAQLIHRPTLTLLQDFMVEKTPGSVHVLNAVSPAFTCAFAFAAWVAENYVYAPGTREAV